MAANVGAVDLSRVAREVESNSCLLETILPILQSLQNVIHKVEKRLGNLEADVKLLHKDVDLQLPAAEESRESLATSTVDSQNIGDVLANFSNFFDETNTKIDKLSEELLKFPKAEQIMTKADLFDAVKKLPNSEQILTKEDLKNHLADFPAGGQILTKDDLNNMMRHFPKAGDILTKEVLKDKLKDFPQTGEILTKKEMDIKLKDLPKSEEILTKGEMLENLQEIKELVTIQPTISYLRHSLPVYVVDLSSKTTTYEMTSADTVWDLKNIIQGKTGQSAASFPLFFGTKLLDDKSTLVSCGVKKWTYLNIGHQITVTVAYGKTITFNETLVLPNVLVSEVKTLIKKSRVDLEEVDFNVYNHSNELLEDTTILRDIGQSVEFKFQIGFLISVIYKQEETKKGISLVVAPTDTFKDVKSKIQAETGISNIEGCLYRLFDDTGRLTYLDLDDNHTVLSYRIKHNEFISVPEIQKSISVLEGMEVKPVPEWDKSRSEERCSRYGHGYAHEGTIQKVEGFDSVYVKWWDLDGYQTYKYNLNQVVFC